MLKHLSLTVLSTVLFFSCSFAATGCRTGDFIYTVQNGTYLNGSVLIPKFTASDRIAKRNWAQDPVCGIDRNTADAYPKIVSPSNPNGQCTSDTNTGDIGTLVNYNPSDSTCVTLPLDDYTPYCVAVVGVFSLLFIRNRCHLVF